MHSVSSEILRELAKKWFKSAAEAGVFEDSEQGRLEAKKVQGWQTARHESAGELLQVIALLEREVAE